SSDQAVHMTMALSTIRALVAWLGLSIVAACGPAFHLPMTATELAQTRDGRALILYLSQPAADPAVCDAAAEGPHIAVDEAAAGALSDALADGTLKPAIWRACVDQVLASAGRSVRIAVLDGMLRVYPRVLENRALDADRNVQARLAALAAA